MVKKNLDNLIWFKILLLSTLFCLIISDQTFSDTQKIKNNFNTYVEVQIECSPIEEYPEQLELLGPGGRHLISADKTKKPHHFKNLKEGRYMFGVKLPGKKRFYRTPSIDLVTLYDPKTGKFSSEYKSAGKNEIIVKEHKKTFIHLTIQRKSGNVMLPIPKVPSSIDIYMTEFKRGEENADEIHHHVKIEILWRHPPKKLKK